MLLSKIKLISIALVFLVIFDVFYINYLAVVFEYAFFADVNRGWLFKSLVYFLSVLPLVFSSQNKTACSIGINLIYAIYFLPSLLVIQYMSMKSNSYILMFLTVLTINMIILFLANRIYLKARFKEVDYEKSIFIFNKIYKLMIFLAAICIFFLIYYFKDNMQLVNFYEVYDLRQSSQNIKTPTYVGYLNLFMVYSALPFLFGYGLIYKSRFALLIGLMAAFIVYLTFGSKIALAIPLAVLIMYKLFFNSKNDLLIMISMLAITAFILNLIDLSDSPLEILKSIFAWRSLANAGWMLEKYDEFFSIHGYSFWTHIGFVGRFFSGEITDQFDLGQLIGIYYFNNFNANYNAGFWASDGIASAGIFGIFVPTIFLSFFIIVLNSLTVHVDYRLISIWFLGLWLVILNAPLTVGLIGGGGLLNFIWRTTLLTFYKSKAHQL